MRRRVPRALVFVAGIIAGLALTLPAPEAWAAGTCLPDIPVTAGLFTSPPTDIKNVASVIPLGNLNPGGGHVQFTDHMYINYPVPNGNGTASYPVYAMARGRIYMLMRYQVAGLPDYDYEIHINHTCSVSSYYIHVHGLSAKIEKYLADKGVPWHDLSGTGSGPWVLFLGQPGGAPMLGVAAGEQVGITKNYSVSWDVGVIDTRYPSGNFENPTPNRYPSLQDLASLFPDLPVDLGVYSFLGHPHLNAQCFIRYLTTAGGLKDQWKNLLLRLHPAQPDVLRRAAGEVRARRRAHSLVRRAGELRVPAHRRHLGHLRPLTG